MSLNEGGNRPDQIDVLDRVLDKGIVIDAWVRVSLVGINLVTVDARVVVSSIDTYLRYADTELLGGPRHFLLKEQHLSPRYSSAEDVLPRIAPHHRRVRTFTHHRTVAASIRQRG